MASPRPLLCTDAAGLLRGSCSGCGGCPSWQLWSCSEVRFRQDGPRSTGAGEAGAQCEACGCGAEQHRNLQDWLAKARRWVQCLVTKDGRWPPEVPSAFRLPAAAQEWEPAGAALHIVTNGQFDPSRDGRRSSSDRAGESRLVSVVCPSIERYHVYHPLLYDCFRRQTHGDSELIVVDSGTTPSAFMVEKAKEDQRVVYRFFFREEHGPERDEDPLERVRQEDDAGEVIEWKFVPWTDAEKAEVRWEGFAMSLGLKRNIACYLARGSAIAHFNAGDLYAPGYLSRILRELGLPFEGEAPVRAAALAEWHGLDLPKESFRRLDFRKKDHVSEEKRERLQLGRGFTLAYTRPTWDKVPFQDDEEPEGRFMKTLQLLSHLRMVQPSRQDVLAAHSYDYATASGANAAASINISGEIKDLEEHSEGVSTPGNFSELMPAVRKLAALANRKRAEEVARLLQLEGDAYFCEKCDAAVALKSNLLEVHRVGNPEGGSCMVAQFVRAGGAIAEGEKVFEDNKPLAPVPQLGSLSRLGGLGVPRLLGIPTQGQLCPNWKAGSSAMNGLRGQAPGLRSVLQPLAKASQELPWFPGWSRRAALCRRCGSAIGRRYEQKEALDLEATIFWALDLKYLKEREAPKAPPPLQDTRVKAKSAAKKAAKATAQEQRPPQKPSPEQKAPAAKKPQQPQEAPRQQKAAPAKPKAAEAKASPSRPVEEAPRIESKASPPANAPVTGPPLASAPVTEARADQQVGVPAEASAVKLEAAKPPSNAPEPAKEPPAALTPSEKKAKDAAEKARAAVRSLSSDLQEQLANGLAAADKSKFDSALNSLKIDAETRRIILLELQVRPGMAASQLEQLVAKAFKTRINMLRSLGIKVIRAVLEEVLPEALREALRKATASSSEGGEDGKASGGGREPRPSPAPLAAPQEGLPAARPVQPPPAAAAEAPAAAGGGGDMAFDFDALELMDPAPPPED